MTRRYATPQAFGQALEMRLHEQVARTTTMTFERLRQLTVFDRFLARVGQQFGERIVVKGGVALELRAEHARTTRDVDLRWSGPTTDVLADLRAAAALDLDDYFTFELEPHREHPTIEAEGMRYGGFRFVVRARLGTKLFSNPFGVDVGIGDALTDPIEVLEGPDTLAFLGIPRTKHRVYPRNAHVAEKLHAYTLPRRHENTRVKDLPDFGLLAMTGPFAAATLRHAIEATFRTRATHRVPTAVPPPPGSWTKSYERMARLDALPWANLDDVTRAASVFLDPILAGVDGTWDPASFAWGT